MNIEMLSIPGVLRITPPTYRDSNTSSFATWSRAEFTALGLSADFVQDIEYFSTEAGTIRGLHCQVAHSAQDKLVRVIKGAIWAVAVDIRRGSPSYGRYVATELSEENGSQLWIPEGFLHGFCTLLHNTHVLCKMTQENDPATERGVIWNDPDLALPWPVAANSSLIADKDLVFPRLAECESWFDYA